MPKSVGQGSKDFVALTICVCSYCISSRHVVVAKYKMASQNVPSQQVDPFLQLA